MKKKKTAAPKKMTNKERFEDWMRNIIQNKHRASFEQMDLAMEKVIN